MQARSSSAGALQLELRRGVALRGEREQEVEPAVVAPVAHAGRAALADADQPRLLQPLERLAHGVAARAELLGQPPLGRHGGAGRERAGEDLGAQAACGCGRTGALVGPVGWTGCTRWLRAPQDVADPSKSSTHARRAVVLAAVIDSNPTWTRAVAALLCAAALLLTACGGEDADRAPGAPADAAPRKPSVTRESVVVGGERRRFVLHHPGGRGRVPLLLAFHGRWRTPPPSCATLRGCTRPPAARAPPWPTSPASTTAGATTRCRPRPARTRRPTSASAPRWSARSRGATSPIPSASTRSGTRTAAAWRCGSRRSAPI